MWSNKIPHCWLVHDTHGWHFKNGDKRAYNVIQNMPLYKPSNGLYVMGRGWLDNRVLC